VQGSGPSRAPESHQELFVCYAGQESHTVPLPNGDKVEIICPVEGKASISRLDNITLPQELPEGYTFASGYEVKISRVDPGNVAGERIPVPVITEGGYIKVSFVAPPIGSEDNYSILFWDEDLGLWIPLNDYVRDANGLPRRFNLHAENPDDLMHVLSGVEFVSQVAPPRVEVATNFPGIFVLALR
jgi:hypothetical protein